MSVAMQLTKRRISSIQATSKITKAMELVAITKLKIWQRKMEVDVEFAAQLEDILKQAIAGAEADASAYLVEPAGVKGDLHIIFSSSLGLCGSYNNNVFNQVDKQLSPDDTILVIGRRGERHYKEYSNKVILDYVEQPVDYDKIRPFGSLVRHSFVSGKYRRIIVHYTQYINSLTSQVRDYVLLPFFEGGYAEQVKPHNEDVSPGPIVEPDQAEFFRQFAPIYLNSMLFSFLLASQVSEQSARRLAMDQATDNANSLIDDLMIEYNTARQAAITQEITEVTGAANGR